MKYNLLAFSTHLSCSSNTFLHLMLHCKSTSMLYTYTQSIWTLLILINLKASEMQKKNVRTLIKKTSLKTLENNLRRKISTRLKH